MEYREKKSRGPVWHIRLVGPILGPRQRPPVSGRQGAGPQAESSPLAQHVEQTATCWWCFGGVGKEHLPQVPKKKHTHKKTSAHPCLFFFKSHKVLIFSSAKPNRPLGPMERRRETSSCPTFIILLLHRSCGFLVGKLEYTYKIKIDSKALPTNCC